MYVSVIENKVEDPKTVIIAIPEVDDIIVVSYKFTVSKELPKIHRGE